MAVLYLRNTITNKRYKIISRNPDTNEVSLQGQSGFVFTQKFDKAELEAMNYVLEKED